MAFIENVDENEPQTDTGEGFLGADPAEQNGQPDQPVQLPPTPNQENQIEGGDTGATPPPPPPPTVGEQVGNPADEGCATKYWCIFPQRIDVDGPDSGTIWNTDDWELPRGCLLAEQGDQATIRLPDSFPTPHRMFLRVVSCWENEFHKSSAPGPQYQFSLVGRLSYRPTAEADYTAHLIFRTTAWTAGLVPRFDVGRKTFHVLTGDVVEGFLKSDVEVPTRSAIVRSWWPSTNQEWMATDAESHWSPNDISWDFSKIYMLPRISHEQLRPGNYKFEHTQAQMNYPVAFENVAQSVVKGYYGKPSKSSPKGPPADASGKYGGKTAVSYPAYKGFTKGGPTPEWGKKGGQWVEAASSSAEPSWEYRRPVGYQENGWQEESQMKGEGWSPSWASKGWIDYRSDKGYYAW